MGVIKININTIVNYINERLAGEQLLYSQLLVFLDGTIDDIKVIVNDVERNILKLGSFFASNRETITIE